MSSLALRSRQAELGTARPSTSTSKLPSSRTRTAGPEEPEGPDAAGSESLIHPSRGERTLGATRRGPLTSNFPRRELQVLGFKIRVSAPPSMTENALFLLPALRRARDLMDRGEGRHVPPGTSRTAVRDRSALPR